MDFSDSPVKDKIRGGDAAYVSCCGFGENRRKKRNKLRHAAHDDGLIDAATAENKYLLEAQLDVAKVLPYYTHGVVPRVPCCGQVTPQSGDSKRWWTVEVARRSRQSSCAQLAPSSIAPIAF